MTAPTRVCSTCGSTNMGEHEQCLVCQSPLAAAVSCPNCSTPARPGAGFCPRCGTSLTRPRWTPTHRVPANGLPAWDAPDPYRQPVTQLAPWTAVQFAEQTGQWARVTCDNGWSGWVDGAQLVPA